MKILVLLLMKLTWNSSNEKRAVGIHGNKIESSGARRHAWLSVQRESPCNFLLNDGESVPLVIADRGLWLEFQECGTRSVIKDESNLEMMMIRGCGNINTIIYPNREEED